MSSYYVCEGCGHQFPRFHVAGQCPGCRRYALVRCSHCGNTAHADVYIANANVCPKCCHSVEIPGSDLPLGKALEARELVTALESLVLLPFAIVAGLLVGTARLVGGLIAIVIVVGIPLGKTSSAIAAAIWRELMLCMVSCIRFLGSTFDSRIGRSDEDLVRFCVTFMSPPLAVLLIIVFRSLVFWPAH